MGVRILLVDDHRLMRKGLRSLLAKAVDFEVVGEADTGRDALDRARELGPDVVLMDLALEQLNGVEATRRLRAELPRVRVLVLSAYADQESVLSALDAGASGYLLKVDSEEELIGAIRSVQQGRRYLSPEITGLVVERGRRSGSADPLEPHASLTTREREVLQLVAEGWTSSEIADALRLSTRTVEQHRRRIMDRLDLHSVAALTRYAIRRGIVRLE